MSEILVTSALPYANGDIHLGHLVEYIQTDIWVRFQKISNNTCYYICADDAHGTAIMLKAQKDNIKPEYFIEKMRLKHKEDFASFLIDFDYYHSTHSEENKELSENIYKKLKNKGYIFTKEIKQLFDEEKNIFLSDRFIKGKCPKCQAKDQYGDNCEKCGCTYNSMELIEPYSVLSGRVPVIKTSEHYFFDLAKLSDEVKNWLTTKDLQPQVRNKLLEWFNVGLKAWDISRDAPYFGFNIPDTKNKYFYVWLDAPIGYMASFKNSVL